VNEVNLAGKRRTVVAHLQSSVLAIAYYSQISRTYPDRFNTSDLEVNIDDLYGFISSDLDTLQEVNYELTYGVDGHGGISKQKYLVDLTYYNESCEPLSGYSYSCTGLNSLLVYIIDLAQIIVSMPYDTISFNTSQVATLSDICYYQLSPLFVETLDYYRSMAYNVVTRVRTAVICIFVLIFPVLLAVNFMLRPMAVQIKQEHKRTLRMLLMIPLNVINNSPAIKDYLDTMLRDAGRTPWYKGRSRKQGQRDDKFLSTHEPLLQAVVRVSKEQ
jgi:hypothetical protein